MAELAVFAQGLTKCFGPVCACEGIDLAVAPGEVVGLVGPDGAGKTTTFRMLCGILPPDHGSAFVAGYDAVGQPEAVKARIGYLPQRFSLHRDLTIDENIKYTAELYTVPRDQWQSRREELLEMTYLAPFRRRLAGRLSGGMRQKLALVCTLIHRPEVLFLDEPTSGVDPNARRAFWELIYAVVAEGVTALVTTHYMDEAEYCSRVGIMRQGKLLAIDSPSALKEQALPGLAWDVFAEPLLPALAVLVRCPRVLRAGLAGDHLRAITLKDVPAAELEQALAQAGMVARQIELVEPTLEDVFLALAKTREGEVEALG